VKQLSEISGRHHVVLIHRVQNADGMAMPVLWLFTDGKPQVFQPLIDYLQDRKSMKLNWQRRAARSLGLFYDFSKSFMFDENSTIRNRHSATLSAFIDALQRGTIPSKGVDKTRLYWAPMSATMVADTARHLDQFLEYVSDLLGELRDDHPLKALRDAFGGRPSDGATMMRFLITSKRLHSRSFLKHLKDDVAGARDQERRSRRSLGLEKKATGYRSVKSMPLQLVTDLLMYGFVKDENASSLFEREDISAKMIFILLVGAGLRASEPLHMWFNDVTFPAIKGEMRCIPALRHPSQAPTFIEGETSNRMQYLKQRELLPRNKATGKSMYVGWKDLATDENTKSTEVYFIHEGLEQLFASYYQYYLNVRRQLVSWRKARGEGDHPFLFVSNGEDRAAGKSYVGSPYSQKAFRDAFERALTRVEARTGQSICRGKNHGTTPHALRHAYAMMLVRAGAPQKLIQKALHHRSILSQSVYTQPEWEDVSTALTAARMGGTHSLLNLEPTTVDPYDDTQDLKEKWHYC